MRYKDKHMPVFLCLLRLEKTRSDRTYVPKCTVYIYIYIKNTRASKSFKFILI